MNWDQHPVSRLAQALVPSLAVSRGLLANVPQMNAENLDFSVIII